eukprot:g35459.t1
MMSLAIFVLFSQVVLSFKGVGRVPGELFRFDFTERQGSIARPATGTKLTDQDVRNLTFMPDQPPIQAVYPIWWLSPEQGNGVFFKYTPSISSPPCICRKR